MKRTTKIPAVMASLAVLLIFPVWAACAPHSCCPEAADSPLNCCVTTKAAGSPGGTIQAELRIFTQPGGISHSLPASAEPGPPIAILAPPPWRLFLRNHQLVI